jgi:hypothetical protein
MYEPHQETVLNTPKCIQCKHSNVSYCYCVTCVANRRSLSKKAELRTNKIKEHINQEQKTKLTLLSLQEKKVLAY